MDIGNDAALRIDQENGLAICDLYNKTKAAKIGRKRVSGRRDKRRRPLLQSPNGLFADEIYRIAMELAAGNEPFKSSRILYTGKVFQHGLG
jgi:hypothetical protein